MEIMQAGPGQMPKNARVPVPHCIIGIAAAEGWSRGPLQINLRVSVHPT
jgi:hypothetical protein